MEEVTTRLNKYLSEKGVCSRREADRLIEAGLVLVNGEPAVPGMKVSETDLVTVRGRRIGEGDAPVLLAVYKPVGIVCTTSEKEKDNIVRFLHYPVRVYPVGRLDKDSEGLLLMTNQGDLVNKILRGSNEHEKEYLVRVNAAVTQEQLDRLRNGVPILDTVTMPCTVEKLDASRLRFVLKQGLNRQIRRMCEAVGLRVRSLKRVRIMNIRLGDMRPGQVREITGRELEELMKLLEGSSNLTYRERKS